MVCNAGTWWKLSGHGPILPHPSPLPSINRFHNSQFVWDWEVDFHIIGSWELLQGELSTGLGFAVSDGSYKASQGSATWILEGASAANQVVGKCFTPSHGNDQSSFWSELAGIYSCLLFIKSCCAHGSLKNPLSAMANWFSTGYRIWPLHHPLSPTMIFCWALDNC